MTQIPWKKIDSQGHKRTCTHEGVCPYPDRDCEDAGIHHGRQCQCAFWEFEKKPYVVHMISYTIKTARIKGDKVELPEGTIVVRVIPGEYSDNKISKDFMVPCQLIEYLEPER